MNEGHAEPAPCAMDRDATERFAEIYSALRQCAARLMRSGRSITLQPTDLVHEAWMKVLAVRPDLIDSREGLLAYAAHAMRTILVDSVRRRRRRTRVLLRMSEDSATARIVKAFDDRTIDVLAID